ncbi:MAG: hypothetical protein IRZ16_16655 [Myxococcaceae bacterium]|nr:hypothetical protein [Myxococcaceae bacterium]
MISLSVLFLTLAAAPVQADSPPDAPRLQVGARTLLASAGTAALEADVVRYTEADAPTTPQVAFLASAFTSLTGLATTFGLFAQPPSSLPLSGFGWRARLATSLFLLSTGPSVGDLLNGDWGAFAIGAGGRTLLSWLAWGAVEYVSSTPGVDGMLIFGTVLLVTVTALVWTGWCAIDLVRAAFAPGRWAERMNASVHPRAPIAEVRRAGALALAW